MARTVPLPDAALRKLADAASRRGYKNGMSDGQEGLPPTCLAPPDIHSDAARIAYASGYQAGHVASGARQ